MSACKSATAYTAAALLLPTPPLHCHHRCHRRALAKLPPPPPSWPLPPRCCHRASVAAVAFVSIVIAVAVIVIVVIVAVSMLLVDC